MVDTEKISEQKFSRNAALKGTAGVVGAAALSRIQIGSDRLEAAATYVRPSAELSGTISIWAQAYNPTPTMTPTAQDPIPRHMLKVVIAEYEKLHPKVTININMHRPTPQDRTWMITQLTGDIAPEIAWAQGFDTNQDIGKGWWVNLDPYLNGPNQYIPAGHPGHDRWIDEFYNSTTQAKRAADGHMYVIPYDLVTTFFFYNKKLFAKAGVTAPPKTWTEFLAVLAALKKAGVQPYNGMVWSQSQLGESLLRGYIRGKVHPSGALGAYTLKDMALAIKHGIYATSLPQWRDWHRLVKETVPYWAPDWALSDAWGGSLDLSLRFTQGNLGILEDGSWRFGLLKANKLVTFDWGSFFMPTVTKGSGPGKSPFVDGKPAPAIGGATSIQFAVTKTAVEKKTLPIAIDFLKYLTAPPQAARIIGEAAQFLPNEKEVHVNEDLRGPLSAVSSGVGEAAIFVYGDKFTTEANDKITKAEQRYYLGQLTLDQLVTQVQAIYTAMANDEIAKFHWK